MIDGPKAYAAPAPTQQGPPAQSAGAAGGRALWLALTAEAQGAAAREPLLGPVVDAHVLRHADLGGALASLLPRVLGPGLLPRDAVEDLVREAVAAEPAVLDLVASDLAAAEARDPAVAGPMIPFLSYKGFHALALHRVAYALWQRGRREVARLLQGEAARALAVDIHPAVPVGRGVFVDHGTGLVVGETATVGNDVSILQGVTLGGTGKERGDRHPKVGDGVLLGAGAKVLGRVDVGRRAKVGAGSVVLRDVPPCATVAGVPARIVGWCWDAVPALAMEHGLPS
jgi:serine O-acetyltransferase